MKKTYLLLTIALLTNLTLFGQQKEEFKKILGHFVIKVHSVSTQKFSDNIETIDSNTERKWDGNASSLIPPPPPPPVPAVFDTKSRAIHFIIMPKHYTKYAVENDFENDSTTTNGVSEIQKIDRENLKVTRFIPLRFETYEGHKKTYSDFTKYKLLEENKKIRKNIAGYDCFQIILDNIQNNMMVEMYVTEQINLNYHPIFNYREILTNYYPLYIKIYNKDFPNDSFDEYKFFKY